MPRITFDHLQLFFVILLGAACVVHASLRPPSVPLLLQSPEINVWSNSDTLQSSLPTRWEGSAADWVVIARVNDQSFLLMGSPSPPWSAALLQTATQFSLSVRSTRTLYTFKASCAMINLTFTSPLLLDDWELLSRPAHYVTASAASDASTPCVVQVYFDITAQVVVREESTSVQWSRIKLNASTHQSPRDSSSQDALRVGGELQSPLSDTSDTPNWGDVYLAIAAAPDGAQISTSLNWVKHSRIYLQSALIITNTNHAAGLQHATLFLHTRLPAFHIL
jgi:hypothetical protein